MSARAETIRPAKSAAALPATEHISIESEPDVHTPEPMPARKVRSTYSLVSRLRACVTEVSILDDHYVAVRSQRPHAVAKDYAFDLRFCNPKPQRVRHIAWFWLSITLGLAALGAAALWQAWPYSILSWLGVLLPGGIGAILASIGAFVYFLHRTTESLEFTSQHGGATLISTTGGIGSARNGKKFFVDLIRNINAAKAARQQPKQQLLRDEMREHHRLRELGVLTDEQYEQSKARILAAHT